MKKNRVLLIALTLSVSLFCMEKPNQISKKELLTLVETLDAKSILFALSHQGAGDILDKEVIQKAQEQHNICAQNAARAQSILLMVTKKALSGAQSALELSQSATQDKEVASKEKTRTSSIKSHTTHHSSQKNHDTSPKKQLMHLIKRRNVDGVTKFMGTTGVHFIDAEIITYAQKKYKSLLASPEAKIDTTLSKEYAIFQLVKKNGPQPSNERRRSCMIKEPSHRVKLSHE